MTWDAIVIGSGFGGAMAAYALVHAGLRVLMLERGSWVSRGPENWGPRGAGLVTSHYSMESPYQVSSGKRNYTAGSWQCVGGQSVFYGGASYRFRERDFESDAEIVGDSGAEWPLRYAELEPFYSCAELLLGVAGDETSEANEPWRSTPYPETAPPLAASARRVADAAQRLGYTPSRIPLAIAYGAGGSRGACIRCGNCDGHACAAEAKNDLASAILPDLVKHGMVLRPNTVCVRLVRSGSRISEVHCVNRVTLARESLTARLIVLGAGTLATPHLLLVSGLDRASPARGAVGRYLMRHRNAIVLGVHRRRPNSREEFDKQIAIFDCYDAAGSVQQMSPPLGLARAYLPKLLRVPAAMLLSHTAGLVAIAEDQPRHENGVTVDWSVVDRVGLPRLRVHHRHTARDDRAAAILIDVAKRVLREAGARFTLVHFIETFTHALGTVRMGLDGRTSPLDGHGRYRGIDNLYVVDGSALPRSAGVNPSLTIAANALRIGLHLSRLSPPTRSRSLRVMSSRYTGELLATAQSSHAKQ
jgi:choline dehydrogenase-like flavoprotein